MGKKCPGYNAIIPPGIRYDKTLSNGAKLLWGEIYALSQDKGYCFANNKFFSEHYQISERTVSSWLELLEKKGYIRKEIKTVDFKTERWIYPTHEVKIIVKNKITKEVPKEIKKIYK
jgi:predicted DNA-binding transcriptional regulator